MQKSIQIAFKRHSESGEEGSTKFDRSLLIIIKLHVAGVKTTVAQVSCLLRRLLSMAGRSQLHNGRADLNYGLQPYCLFALNK